MPKMTSRSPSPLISGRCRRLASQSPSPNRTSKRVFHNGGGDHWFDGGRGDENGISIQMLYPIDGAGDAAAEPDISDRDPESLSFNEAIADLENLHVEPPSSYSHHRNKMSVADLKPDNESQMSSLGSQERPSRGRRKSQSQQDQDQEYAYQPKQEVNAYLGPLGKGRGRPIVAQIVDATFQQGEKGIGRGLARRSYDLGDWQPSRGVGRGTPRHDKLPPKGRGTPISTVRRSTGGDFWSIPNPPFPGTPSDLSTSVDDSFESAMVFEPPEKFRDGDSCCGGPEEVPSSKHDSSASMISGSHKRRYEYYSALGKRQFGEIRYIDTHCHLDLLFRRDGFHQGTYSEYVEKRKETWAQCYEGCIADFCYPATFQTTQPLWESLLTETGVYLAFGCHPHVASDYNDDVEKWIIERMSHPKVVAVGEMGLDYSRNNKQDHDLQKEVFKRQLRLAIKCGKPLVIHCREAEEDCHEIMKEIVPADYPIHRHCFTGSLEDVRRWTDHFTKLKIGLTTAIYEPRGNQYTLLRKFPLDRILIETDSPYFLPRYARWRDFGGLELNHPGIGYVVAAKLAELRNLEMGEVLRIIRANTKEIYGI